MSTYHQILRTPLITEKNTGLKERFNTYVFDVDPAAGKRQIKEAVEKLFSVKVLQVRTIVVKGKLKRMGRHAGYRPDRKKALVRIEKGQTIQQFGES